MFTVSAIFFCVAAVRDGGLIGLAASSSFLVACVVFIVPAVLNRPRSD